MNNIQEKVDQLGNLLEAHADNWQGGFEGVSNE